MVSNICLLKVFLTLKESEATSILYKTFVAVHGYELKMLWQHFTLKQKLNYYLRNFIYEFLLKIPPIKRYVNYRLNAIMQLDLSRYFQAS